MKNIFSKFFNKKTVKKLSVNNRDFYDNALENNINKFEEVKLTFHTCNKCKAEINSQDFISNLCVCPHCNYHFKINVNVLMNIILDKNTFVEYDGNLSSKNIINFPLYDDKLFLNKKKTNRNDAVISGTAKINDIDISVAFMDFQFMGGSMGIVVGEKIARTFERALDKKVPVVIFVTSGGARMQEGMFSLMQMAKTSLMVKKLSDNNLPYITVLLNPTTGGVMASFSMLSDIIISEPNTKIGFSGEKVIKQIVNEDFPNDFQTSEFLFRAGMIDIISDRKDLKNNISKLLNYLY